MNSDDKSEDKDDLSDIPPHWVIEEIMLEDYFLLVRRISGINLSIEDYWNLDTWTTAKLLDMERQVIKAEQDAMGDNEEYVERPDGNSEYMNDLMDEMTEE